MDPNSNQKKSKDSVISFQNKKQVNINNLTTLKSDTTGQVSQSKGLKINQTQPTNSNKSKIKNGNKNNTQLNNKDSKVNTTTTANDSKLKLHINDLHKRIHSLQKDIKIKDQQISSKTKQIDSLQSQMLVIRNQLLHKQKQLHDLSQNQKNTFETLSNQKWKNKILKEKYQQTQNDFAKLKDQFNHYLQKSKSDIYDTKEIENTLTYNFQACREKIKKELALQIQDKLSKDFVKLKQQQKVKMEQELKKKLNHFKQQMKADYEKLKLDKSTVLDQNKSELVQYKNRISQQLQETKQEEIRQLTNQYKNELNDLHIKIKEQYRKDLQSQKDKFKESLKDLTHKIQKEQENKYRHLLKETSKTQLTHFEEREKRIKQAYKAKLQSEIHKFQKTESKRLFEIQLNQIREKHQIYISKRKLKNIKTSIFEDFHFLINTIEHNQAQSK